MRCDSADHYDQCERAPRVACRALRTQRGKSLLTEGNPLALARSVHLRRPARSAPPAGHPPAAAYWGSNFFDYVLPEWPGTPTTRTFVEDLTLAIDLGFWFPFYDAAYRNAYVSTNGFVTFGAPDYCTSVARSTNADCDLPGSLGMGELDRGVPLIAPFWRTRATLANTAESLKPWTTGVWMQADSAAGYCA